MPGRRGLHGLMSEGAGSQELATLLVACLIARTDRDQLDVAQDEIDRLHELFPQGWGLVVAAVTGEDGSAALRATLVGEQSMGLIAGMIDRISSGEAASAMLPIDFLPRRPDGR